MRSPHVNVPAESVTGVFQNVSVQVEHPQWVTAWEGVGSNVGSLEGTEVVGRLLGDDDGWSVGNEVGLFEGVGFNVGRLEGNEVVGRLLGADDGWSVGEDVGLSEGAQEGDWLGV